MDGFILHGVVSIGRDLVSHCASRCGTKSIERVGCFKGIVTYRKPGNAGYDVTVQPGSARNLASVAGASEAYSIHRPADRTHSTDYLHFGRCNLGDDRLVDKLPDPAKAPATL